MLLPVCTYSLCSRKRQRTADDDAVAASRIAKPAKKRVQVLRHVNGLEKLVGWRRLSTATGRNVAWGACPSAKTRAFSMDRLMCWHRLDADLQAIASQFEGRLGVRIGIVARADTRILVSLKLCLSNPTECVGHAAEASSWGSK